MRLEIPLLELGRVARRPSRIEAILRIEWIESRIDLPRIIVNYGRVDAAQSVDGVARMRVHEHHAVAGRQAREHITAGHEFPGALANRGALLSHRLVVAHRRSAAAVAEQHDLRYPRLLAHELHA